MPSVSQTYAGNFLNASELPTDRRLQAVITGVVVQTIGQGVEAQPKMVMSLKSTSGKDWRKTVVLNKTNASILAAMFGDETDSWRGRHIEVWQENVMFQGRLLPGIRMTGAPPAHPAPTPLQNALATAGRSSKRTVLDDEPAVPDQVASGDDLDDEIPF